MSAKFVSFVEVEPEYPQKFTWKAAYSAGASSTDTARLVLKDNTSDLLQSLVTETSTNQILTFIDSTSSGSSDVPSATPDVCRQFPTWARNLVIKENDIRCCRYTRSFCPSTRSYFVGRVYFLIRVKGHGMILALTVWTASRRQLLNTKAPSAIIMSVMHLKTFGESLVDLELNE